jgi:hypothetical protein
VPSSFLRVSGDTVLSSLGFFLWRTSAILAFRGEGGLGIGEGGNGRLWGVNRERCSDVLIMFTLASSPLVGWSKV